MYFGAIKEIMSHRSDLQYGIITNGKLLDKDTVEWLNKYHVSVTVSWDGPISQYTRGYDVLKENPNIKDINTLGVSAVLTKWTVVHEVVDSANELTIFFRIMLPLVKPGLMTLGIFHLMNNWNDLLYPLMMTSDTDMRTLSAGLALFVGEHATLYYGPQLAGAVICIMPLLILYIFFQKYFVSSAVSSGIKG